MSVDLGQNFLTDREVLTDIITAADLQADDVVLEIGPGKGVLTEELAKRAGQVIAIELDRALVPGLQKKFHAQKNVTIVHDDILRWWGEGAQFPTDSSSLRSASRRDASLPASVALRLIGGSMPASVALRLIGGSMPASVGNAAKEESRQGNCFMGRVFKVVANIPYRITAPILRMFLEGTNRPALMVLMVQKEVAKRVCAKPGDMSMLSVSVQYYATPEIVRIVPRTAFDPAPKVDSAILRICPDTYYLAEKFTIVNNPALFEERFFRLVKMGFASRRKQLQNLLASGLHITNAEVKEVLHAVGLPPTVRAQELSLTHWKELVVRFFS